MYTKLSLGALMLVATLTLTVALIPAPTSASPAAVVWIEGLGGKVWPDWHVGSPGDAQKLYARVRNTGDSGIYVIVTFMVFDTTGMPIFSSPLRSTAGWLPAATFVIGDVVDPSSVDVETPLFRVLRHSYYFFVGWVYLSDVSPEGPWIKWDPSMGGNGISRDPSTNWFKVI